MRLLSALCRDRHMEINQCIERTNNFADTIPGKTRWGRSIINSMSYRKKKKKKIEEVSQGDRGVLKLSPRFFYFLFSFFCFMDNMRVILAQFHHHQVECHFPIMTFFFLLLILDHHQPWSSFNSLAWWDQVWHFSISVTSYDRLL